MKRVLLILAGVLAISGSAQAKPKAAKAPCLPVQTMTIDHTAQGPNCPMMQSMPVMIQVLKLQQKLDEGVSGSERKEILEDKAKLIGVLEAAQAEMKGMPCMSGQMPCMQPGMNGQMPGAPQKTPPCMPAPKK